MKPIVLSSSSISLFLECPRCFWLQINNGIKRPAGIFPSLPSGMDRILKEHFDSHRKNGSMPHELEGRFEGFLFSDKDKLDEWRNNRKGLRFFDGKANAELMGALDDLLVTEQGLYAPLDFKTRGYPTKEDSHEYYQHQMDIYSFLLEKNSMPSAGFAILLFYHPKCVTKSCHVEFEANPVRIKTSVSAGERVFREAIKCLLGDEPRKSKDCEWCGWRMTI